jgi:hypothetical protein
MTSKKNMWEQTEEIAKKHEMDSTTWLKLANDGDGAVVVFLGEPFPREVCFVDGRYMPFDEELKAKGLKPSLRVAVNVALYDTKEVKVLEQGIVVFKDLMQIRAKYGLPGWAFEVQRHGAAKDLKTTYSILPEHQLTPEEQKEFQALPLHDLEKLYSDSGEETLASYDRKADGLIDPKTAQSIAVVLKALPREAIDRFCKKFEVARIKDLPASQVEKALAYAGALEKEFRAAHEPDGSIDPFAE